MGTLFLIIVIKDVSARFMIASFENNTIVYLYSWNNAALPIPIPREHYVFVGR